MNPEEITLVAQALRATEGCARRLARSQEKLRPRFPLSSAAVGVLPSEVEDDIDAFLSELYGNGFANASTTTCNYGDPTF